MLKKQRSGTLPRLVVILLLGSVLSGAAAPQPSDHRYEITLFAESPDIVTPIGASTDDQGRLFVVESHTMNPPQGYAGPTNDLIKVFTDRNQDGRADDVKVFAGGLTLALRVLVQSDGSVLVCGSTEIVRLRDTDGDGRADQREQLLRFECENLFLTGLWAMTVSPEGELYVVRILTPFPHRTIGSDGSSISGYGDGGAVLRCRADGSKLEEVATGFWAPPSLRFDRSGRLLMVDNDPASKGPNRLILCVDQGDYGFRARYGPGGDSPLVALMGELPGTLPAFGVLHEAPSDFWVCGESPFPAGYENSLLVTSWGANLIERHELSGSGGNLKTTRSRWVEGGADFKPSGMTVDVHGNLFVTDWVRNDFQNHGQGKIWRIAPKRNVAMASPLPSPKRRWRPEPNQEGNDVRPLDPVARHVTTLALSHRLGEARKHLDSADAGRRLEALMALRRGLTNQVEINRVIRHGLADQDRQVRLGAIFWIGDQQRTEHKEDLTKLLGEPGLSPRVVEVTLAALATLDDQFLSAIQARVPFPDEKLPKTLPDSITHPLLRSARLAPDSTVQALRWLEDPTRPRTKSLLRRLVRGRPAPLNLAALELLKDGANEEDVDWLLAVTKETKLDPSVRATALSTCAGGLEVPILIGLLRDPQESVQLEAVLELRHRLTEGKDSRSEILSKLSAASRFASPRVKSEIQSILAPQSEERPSTLADWQRRVATGGDPSVGRRRFFSASAQCSRCHSIQGRGGSVAPDLGLLAWTQNRPTIIRSILRPSEFFGPEYQMQEVETKSGTTFAGALMGVEPDGSMTLQLASGECQRVEGNQIEHQHALQSSLMPDGLEAVWSVESLRDVVAFLSEYRGR